MSRPAKGTSPFTPRTGRHRAYVMDSGLITLTGEAREMLHGPKVRAAWLGEGAA